MLKSELLSLGLTKPEVKIYLSLLELGGAVVSSVAKYAKLNRVTSYNTLSNLVNSGYVTVTQRKGVRFYVPESPTVLVSKLEEKYVVAQKVLPELLALQNSASFTPHIRYYEERENIAAIFGDMAQAKTDIRGYTNFQPLKELFPSVLKSFAKAMERKQMKSRFLAPFDNENKDCIKEYFSTLTEVGLMEIFTVNTKQFSFKNGVFFYDDKMAIISYDKKELLGVIIQSAVNTQTQKAMFDLAWLGATSFIVR